MAWCKFINFIIPFAIQVKSWLLQKNYEDARSIMEINQESLMHGLVVNLLWLQRELRELSVGSNNVEMKIEYWSRHRPTINWRSCRRTNVASLLSFDVCIEIANWQVAWSLDQSFIQQTYDCSCHLMHARIDQLMLHVGLQV